MASSHLSSRMVLPALFALASCGPVQSTSIIVDAQAELAAAQTAGGEKHAPFEYVAAEEYLHKAREEQSYADFEVAVKFGQKSWECARAARQIAERATRAGMGMEADAPKKPSVCHAGPDRGPGSLAASEEPAARGIPVAKREAEPADPEPSADERKGNKKSDEPADPEPERATVKSKSKEPADPEPAKAKAKDEPKSKKDEPKPKKEEPKHEDEPLPEGDE